MYTIYTSMRTALLLVLSSSFIPWYYRHRRSDPTAATDFIIFLVTGIWHTRDHVSPTHIALCLCVVLLVPLLDLIFDHNYNSGRQKDAVNTNHGESFAPPWTSPLLIPGRTTHTRFFPSKHSFSYSYFMLGIPVGWTGHEGYWLSVDTNRRALLEINASDCLVRGLEESGLRGKLDYYLISQGVDPRLYPFAFLVTAPRVLGYSFNPVSFWYLYSEEGKGKELSAMILEVNNTFDERRLYLLRRDDASATREEATFSTTWAKDFHVSPFNDRAGSYSLSTKALDFQDLTAGTWMSNTITLSTPENKPKLVARIFSSEPPTAALDIPLMKAMSLIIRFGWVGFVTFPRIIKEASTLYFKKGLQVWFRPEVARGSIGRTPTADEKVLERFFRRYIEYCVDSCEFPVRLTYRPAQGLGLREEYTMESEMDGDGEKEEVTLDVLTPAFYSRFLHYISLQDAIKGEGLWGESKNHSIHVVPPQTLLEVARSGRDGGAMTVAFQKAHPRQSTIGDVPRWMLLSYLRCAPPRLSYGPDSSQISGGGMSDLDFFIRLHCHDAWMYRRLAISQFLAQRYAMGLLPIIRGIDVAIRLVLTLISWWSISSLLSSRPVGGHGLVAPILLANASNLYGFVKGL